MWGDNFSFFLKYKNYKLIKNMNKIKTFFSNYSITIFSSVVVLLLSLGVFYVTSQVSTTTIGEDMDIAGDLTIGGNADINGGIKVGSGSTTKPTCDSTTRGMMWMEQGESGQADSPSFCIKNSSDSYSWTVNLTTCGDNITDSRDGNTYPTVEIGTQCWTAKNMAYLPSVVPSSTGDTEVPYYYVYGYQGTSTTSAKATSNYTTYGVLYNHLAAETACPTGWHLPTDTEQYTLENYLSTGTCNASRSNSWDCDPAGAKLAGTFSLWSDGTLRNHANFGETGFNALPSGYRNTDGSFYYLGTYTDFWSSSVSSSSAWYRNLGYSESRVNRLLSSKAYGFSVRCVRD
jgi:uncharacterized protein (TIGR02145 family)